ncbi:replicative DNA helicase [candidate division KSB1 bacterium 4484_87]|nr:MAG: replicative DNA helicase [candidate division KSB1 bacterium 4484_87]
MAQNEKKAPMIQRSLPHDIDAEMAVLGAMFIDMEAVGKVIEIIPDTNYFYNTAHQKIYQAAVELNDKRAPIDVITLTDKLKKNNSLEAVGGQSYLLTLAEKVPSSANVEYYARIVLEKALLRRLIELNNEIIQKAYDHSGDVYELLDKVEREMFALAERKQIRGFQWISPTLFETMSKIQSFAAQAGGITGVPSGFRDLDKLTSGFQDSDLVIIAGRPSMGKTAFCLNIARNAALDHNVPVGLFSLEMSSQQLAMRLLCAEARVDSNLVRTGRLPKNEFPKLSVNVGKLAAAPIYIDDTPAMNILEIKSKARRLKHEKNIGLLIIDYLQLIHGPTSKAESRQIEISAISRSLKALAKELDIPVLALSQLSRAVEARGGDRRPMLSDLRDSGAIEQDADMVIFIYRPERYGITEKRGVAEIIIGKNRNGPVDTVELTFIPEYTMFSDKFHGKAENEQAAGFN